MAPIIPLIGAAAAAAGGAAGAAGVTGTIAGISASTIANVATVVGTLVSAAGTAVQAEQAADQQEAQAKVIEEQGRQRALQSSIEAENLRRQNRVRQSAARAAAAEGGALSGTTFGLLDQNAVAGELDALTLSYQGQRESYNAGRQGAVMRSSASNTRAGGYLSAGAELAGGIGDYAAKQSPDPLNWEFGGASGGQFGYSSADRPYYG